MDTTGQTVQYVDAILTPGRYYAYQIQPVNPSGVGPKSPVQFAQPLDGGPAAPDASSVIVIAGEGRVQFTFPNPDNGIRFQVYGFEVPAATASSVNANPPSTYGGTTATLIGSSVPGDANYLVQSLGNGRQLQGGHLYEFAFSAMDYSGEGPLSGPVLAIPTVPVDPNAAPSIDSFDVAVAGKSSAYLKWHGTGASYILNQSPWPACGGTPSTGSRTLFPDEFGGGEAWVTGLTDGTTYSFSVSQVNNDFGTTGTGGASTNLTYSASGYSVPFMPALSIVQANGHVSVSWGGSSPADFTDIQQNFADWRWILQRRDDSDSRSDSCGIGSYSVWTSVADGVGGYQFDDTSVVNYQAYRYKLVAISPAPAYQVLEQVMSYAGTNAAGATNWVVPQPSFAANAVLAVTATPANQAIILGWNVVTNAVRYEIRRSGDAGGHTKPLVRLPTCRAWPLLMAGLSIFNSTTMSWPHFTPTGIRCFQAKSVRSQMQPIPLHHQADLPAFWGTATYLFPGQMYQVRPPTESAVSAGQPT